MNENSKLNVTALLRAGGTPQNGSAQFSFANEDFAGYMVPGKTSFEWTATPLQDKLDFSFCLNTTLLGICARCLQECTFPLQIKKIYRIREKELVGEFSEYPTVKDGIIDLEELAYGEIVMEAPQVLLCKEDCPGLCGVCGSQKTKCACVAAPKAVNAPDARWNTLRALLDEESSGEQ